MLPVPIIAQLLISRVTGQVVLPILLMRLILKLYEKRGQTRSGGLALKTMWFCEALLLGDQNLFGRDGSLSQFDILLRSLRRAIRQFHAKIGQVHRSNK